MEGCWKSVGCVFVDFGRALAECRTSDERVFAGCCPIVNERDTCVGRILCECWTSVERVLNECFTGFVDVLDKCWTRDGQILSGCRTSVGRVSVQSRTSFVCVRHMFDECC